MNSHSVGSNESESLSPKEAGQSGKDGEGTTGSHKSPKGMDGNGGKLSDWSEESVDSRTTITKSAVHRGASDISVGESSKDEFSHFPSSSASVPKVIGHDQDDTKKQSIFSHDDSQLQACSDAMDFIPP